MMQSSTKRNDFGGANRIAAPHPRANFSHGQLTSPHRNSSGQLGQLGQIAATIAAQGMASLQYAE
jgi:hypothetical protein